MQALSNGSITFYFETSFTALIQSHSFSWTELHLRNCKFKLLSLLLECYVYDIDILLTDWNIYNKQYERRLTNRSTLLINDILMYYFLVIVFKPIFHKLYTLINKLFLWIRRCIANYLSKAFGFLMQIQLLLLSYIHI